MLASLFWLLLSLSTVLASPTHPSDTLGGSSCLAVLLTLFLLLSALLIGKRMFLNTRKSSSCSIATDCSARSSALILPSTADRGSTKAAFLVGFFGSPAWETSVTNLVDKSRCPDYIRSSFSHQLSTGSRRSKYTRTLNSSLTDKGSLLDLAKSRSLSLSTVGDIRALYEIPTGIDLGRQRKSPSLKLPTRPPKAYTGSVASRRFSMPSVGRKDPDVSHRKRTSSLKSSTTKRSYLPSPSFPSNSSLRLVEPIDNPDHPLPFSQNSSVCPISPPNAFQVAASGSTSRHDKAPGPLVPPLPPIPLSTFAQSEHNSTTMSTLRISHPYALSPAPHSPGPFVNKPVAGAGQPYTYFAPNMKEEQHDSVVASRKPLSPVLGSINLSPLLVPYSHTTYLTAPASPPQPHSQTPNTSPKIKQKARVRRSPAIGPSPLRAMILPDPSDPSVRTSVSQVGSRNSNTTLDYSRLGLGIPSTLHTTTRGLHNAVTPASEGALDPRKRSSRAMEVESDPNLLLGIIQELVEETSHWDSSLFKDKTFKAMIDNSKRPSFKADQCRGRVMKEGLSSRDAGIPEDESEEFDLNLLGLDIFRSNGEIFVPGIDDRTPLDKGEGDDDASFRWLDQDPQGDLVGVAC